MSFRLSVETSTGDVLKVLSPQGQGLGNALLSFIVPIANYCAGEIDSPVREWVEALGIHGERMFCEIFSSIVRAHSSGGWKYQEGEFRVFQQQHPHLDLTENDFIGALRELDRKWTSVDTLAADVSAVSVILRAADPPSTWWYDVQRTVPELQALHQTLAAAADGGAECVRLIFE